MKYLMHAPLLCSGGYGRGYNLRYRAARVSERWWIHSFTVPYPPTAYLRARLGNAAVMLHRSVQRRLVYAIRFARLVRFGWATIGLYGGSLTPRRGSVIGVSFGGGTGAGVSFWFQDGRGPEARPVGQSGVVFRGVAEVQRPH